MASGHHSKLLVLLSVSLAVLDTAVLADKRSNTSLSVSQVRIPLGPFSARVSSLHLAQRQKTKVTLKLLFKQSRCALTAKNKQLL